MFTTILTALLSKAIPSAADFFIKKEQLKQERELAKLQGKIEFEKMKTQRFAESLSADNIWELERIRAAGWMDNGTWLVLATPLVMVFIPPMAPYVLQGFEILQQTPDWYRWLVVMIFAATFGIRIWRRQM